MTDLARKPLYPPSAHQLANGWRRSFIHDATVSVLGRMRKTSAEEIRLELRGAVTPMKAADYPGGTVARLLLLAPDSAAAKLFELAVQVDLTGISSFSFPLASSFTEAKFTEEGAPIGVGQGTFAGIPLGPVRKLALIAALSNELENASAGVASTVIEHLLKVAVGNGLSKILFSADAGVPDVSPAGLLNGVAPLAAGASMAADLAAIVGAIAASGVNTENLVLVAAPQQALAIRLNAGPLFPYRVIGAPIAAGTVIGIATDSLVVAGDGNPIVDVSRHGTLHMDDATPLQIGVAGTPTTIAAPTVSMFQTDSYAIRCVARICWAATPGSVAWIQNVVW